MKKIRGKGSKVDKDIDRLNKKIERIIKGEKIDILTLKDLITILKDRKEK